MKIKVLIIWTWITLISQQSITFDLRKELRIVSTSNCQTIDMQYENNAKK